MWIQLVIIFWTKTMLGVLYDPLRGSLQFSSIVLMLSLDNVQKKKIIHTNYCHKRLNVSVLHHYDLCKLFHSIFTSHLILVILLAF